MNIKNYFFGFYIFFRYFLFFFFLQNNVKIHGETIPKDTPILISWLARGKKDRQKDIYLKLHKFLTLMIPRK